jgi:ribosomal protein S18 acetylase RimI-like enzyme
MTLVVHRLTNKEKILAFLMHEHLYAAYAIGDLEPDLFAQTEWVGAEKSGHLIAMSLCFRGLQPPALFLMGANEGLDEIFEAGNRPENVYLLCRLEHYLTTKKYYSWKKRLPMWRMVTDPVRFQAVDGDPIRLNTTHIDQLVDLFGDEGADAFSPSQVPSGVFYGIFQNNHLVSAAGTHLVSPTFNIAAVGNIYTLPDYRGKGYGTQTTSAVVSELIRQGIEDIVLNVEQDNLPANRLYDRLGFERYCPFYEGLAAAL